jgi:DNA end-binding protein Ku
MWKGVISFGMVSIPIRLYVATESHSVSFHQLCPEHHARIKYKRWCPVGEHEVNYGEVERGYEVGDDRYVIIDEKDLENLPLPTSRSIEINEFVPKNDIPAGLYFKNAYYIEPEEAGRKPYYLLKAALDETDRVAIAKIALRDREHLCALESQNGLILMNTLNWPDEIRPTEGLKGLDEEIKVNPKELAMAKVLVESLADDFDPERYHDDYHEALKKVVEAKLEGKVVEAPEAPAETRVMDLMDALRASVEAAKAKKPPAAPAKEKAKRVRRAS